MAKFCLIDGIRQISSLYREKLGKEGWIPTLYLIIKGSQTEVLNSKAKVTNLIKENVGEYLYELGVEGNFQPRLK